MNNTSSGSNSASGSGSDTDEENQDTIISTSSTTTVMQALQDDFLNQVPDLDNPQAAANANPAPTAMQEIQAAFQQLTSDLDRTIQQASQAHEALDARERSVQTVHRDSLAPTMKVLVAGQPFEFKRDTVRNVASDGALLKDLVDGNFGAPQGTTPFLDRDPGMFQHVLQWHRNGGQLPSIVCMDRCTLEDLRFEAGFYSEPKLGEQVTAELARREERLAGRWVADPVIRKA